MEMTELGATRLNDARLLVLRAKPENFNMSYYADRCGTPACVIGHYAAWTGQREIRFAPNHVSLLNTHCGGDLMCEHFEISCNDAHALFGTYGCDDAKTPQQAADCIAAFLVRKNFAHCVTDRLSTDPEPVEVVASAPASERCRGLRMEWEREVVA